MCGGGRTGDVIINDYCWIGIKTTIIGPVSIGANSVIGANSLVNKDLPPNSISMGVPAKVVKFKSYVPVEIQREFAIQYKGVISDKLLDKLYVQ